MPRLSFPWSPPYRSEILPRVGRSGLPSFDLLRAKRSLDHGARWPEEPDAGAAPFVSNLRSEPSVERRPATRSEQEPESALRKSVGVCNKRAVLGRLRAEEERKVGDHDARELRRSQGHLREDLERRRGELLAPNVEMGNRVRPVPRTASLAEGEFRKFRSHRRRVKGVAPA